MGCELKQWAPSRWSHAKTVLFLKHARKHLCDQPSGTDYCSEGVTDAIMTLDVALSQLGIVERSSFRIIEPAQNKLGFKERIVGDR